MDLAYSSGLHPLQSRLIWATRHPDRLKSPAQEISQHKGWRFMLATLDEGGCHLAPASESELSDWSQLDEKLREANDLVNRGIFEPALLYLWSIFEAAIRKRAIALNIPVDRLPAHMLWKHMYSQGEVFVEDIALYQEFMNKRNG